MKKYSTYLIELVVIVTGITLSFMVDEWRDDNKKRQDVEKALSLMIKNLEADSVKLFKVNEDAALQEGYLKLLLRNNGPIHDSLLLNCFWATWTVTSQITIQKSALDNLNSIQGLDYKTEGFQSILDNYYDFSILYNELIDWHLTNQRIDDLKWKKLMAYNELVIILQDTIQDDYSQIQNNEHIKTDLRNYFKDQDIKMLLADKYMMVKGVRNRIKYEIEENAILKKAILNELKD